jgi:hypothetical protein
MNPSMEDEDLMFDCFENSVDPSFFNMNNPTTLADLSIDKNNNNVGPTALSQQTQHGPHQNLHGVGIVSNFNDLFSTPPSQENYYGLGILGGSNNNGNDPFNSNVLPQQNQSGNNDPFAYNLESPENDHHIQQLHGGSNDPFIYHDIQQGQDGNIDSFSDVMLRQNHHDVQQHGHGHGSTNETFSVPMVQDQYDQNNNNFSFGINSLEVDGSSSRMYENQQQSIPAIQIPVLLNQTELRALNQWPPTVTPYFCSCCQVLREIIHTDG